MFILRNVKIGDLSSLMELARLQSFINLPADEVELKRKIQKSQASFKSPSQDKENNFYIFVLEELESQKIIGTSMIHGKHGTLKEPHFYLTVGQEHKFSKSLNTGFIHGTLKFGLETDGHTEIGGLVLNPTFRGNKEKLGKQLSFIRFLYIANHLNHFTEFIHVELMPPLDNLGNSPLWEAIGRKFLNMDYIEADKLSRSNKEFILNLYPIDTIYEALLPVSARNAIGKVGLSTEPVKKMLENIGFHYTEEVDPFDGGPHYRAKTTDIKIIKNFIKGEFVPKSLDTKNNLVNILVNYSSDKNNFKAFFTPAYFNNDKIEIDKERCLKLGIKKPFKANAIYI